MPQYEYLGSHGNGAPANGVVEALDVNEALSKLSVHGLKVKSIRPAANVQAPAGLAKAPVSRGQAPMAAGAVRGAQSHSALAGAGVQAAYPLTVVRTPPASYWDNHFFFLQLGEMLRSGISPAEALKVLGQRTRMRHMAAAAPQLARAVSGGMALSDALAAYPDLFSPGTVGGIRAGEHGGYMADAVLEVGRQNGEAARYNRFFWFYPVALGMMLGGMFTGLVMSRLVNRGIDAVNGQIGVEQIVSMGLADFMRGPWPWVFGAIILASLWWAWAKKRNFTRPFRHALALKYPVVGSRSRNENLGIFGWHMMRLSEAGLSPWKSWTLAAEAVPNIRYRDMIKAEAGPANEAMGFSAIAGQSRLVPTSYLNLIQTGEMTGRLPQAFDQVMRMGAEESKTSANIFKLMMTISGAILVLTSGLLGFVLFYGTYLKEVFRILE